MPVNPIDLQTNFSQINHVGRQQSNIKDSENLKELQISLTVQKQSENETEDIPITKDLSEGPGRIKDENGGKKKNKHQFEEKENKKSDEDQADQDQADDEEKKNKLEVKDSPVGRIIDIIG